jgi:hypothetical protein
MAADTDTKPNDTKPADSAKATPQRKPASRAKAKTTTKSRSTRNTRSTRSASKPRKPATARAPRSEPTATTAAETARPQAKALNGGQQFVAGVIDAQEKTVEAIVDYQARAAQLSQIPGATAVAEAQAQVLRNVTGAYVSAARAFLK